MQKGSVDGVQNQSSFPLLQLALVLARGSLKVPAKISQSIVAPTYNPSTGQEVKAGEACLAYLTNQTKPNQNKTMYQWKAKTEVKPGEQRMR